LNPSFITGAISTWLMAAPKPRDPGQILISEDCSSPGLMPGFDNPWAPLFVTGSGITMKSAYPKIGQEVPDDKSSNQRRSRRKVKIWKKGD
jgi:hypothetical protein